MSSSLLSHGADIGSSPPPQFARSQHGLTAASSYAQMHQQHAAAVDAKRSEYFSDPSQLGKGLVLPRGGGSGGGAFSSPRHDRHHHDPQTEEESDAMMAQLLAVRPSVRHNFSNHPSSSSTAITTAATDEKATQESQRVVSPHRGYKNPMTPMMAERNGNTHQAASPPSASTSSMPNYIHPTYASSARSVHPHSPFQQQQQRQVEVRLVAKTTSAATNVLTATAAATSSSSPSRQQYAEMNHPPLPLSKKADAAAAVANTTANTARTQQQKDQCSHHRGNFTIAGTSPQGTVRDDATRHRIAAVRNAHLRTQLKQVAKEMRIAVSRWETLVGPSTFSNGGNHNANDNVPTTMMMRRNVADNFADVDSQEKQPNYGADQQTRLHSGIDVTPAHANTHSVTNTPQPATSSPSHPSPSQKQQHSPPQATPNPIQRNIIHTSSASAVPWKVATFTPDRDRGGAVHDFASPPPRQIIPSSSPSRPPLRVSTPTANEKQSPPTIPKELTTAKEIVVKLQEKISQTEEMIEASRRKRELMVADALKLHRDFLNSAAQQRELARQIVILQGILDDEQRQQKTKKETEDGQRSHSHNDALTPPSSYDVDINVSAVTTTLAEGEGGEGVSNLEQDEAMRHYKTIQEEQRCAKKDEETLLIELGAQWWGGGSGGYSADSSGADALHTAKPSEGDAESEKVVVNEMARKWLNLRRKTRHLERVIFERKKNLKREPTRNVRGESIENRKPNDHVDNGMIDDRDEEEKYLDSQIKRIGGCDNDHDDDDKEKCIGGDVDDDENEVTRMIEKGDLSELLSSSTDENADNHVDGSPHRYQTHAVSASTMAGVVVTTQTPIRGTINKNDKTSSFTSPSPSRRSPMPSINTLLRLQGSFAAELHKQQTMQRRLAEEYRRASALLKEALVRRRRAKAGADGEAAKEEGKDGESHGTDEKKPLTRPPCDRGGDSECSEEEGTQTPYEDDFEGSDGKEEERVVGIAETMTHSSLHSDEGERDEEAVENSDDEHEPREVPVYEVSLDGINQQYHHQNEDYTNDDDDDEEEEDAEHEFRDDESQSNSGGEATPSILMSANVSAISHHRDDDDDDDEGGRRTPPTAAPNRSSKSTHRPPLVPQQNYYRNAVADSPPKQQQSAMMRDSYRANHVSLTLTQPQKNDFKPRHPQTEYIDDFEQHQRENNAIHIYIHHPNHEPAANIYYSAPASNATSANNSCVHGTPLPSAPAAPLVYHHPHQPSSAASANTNIDVSALTAASTSTTAGSNDKDSPHRRRRHVELAEVPTDLLERELEAHLQKLTAIKAELLNRSR